jgi:fumarylacetoacetate (FAA) hydrolase
MGRLRRELVGSVEMKLASLKEGRDGRLVVVSRDLSRALPIPHLASTLQQALDCWADIAPLLEREALRLERGEASGAFPFRAADCAAPLPRAYQWADGSAYLAHMERVRKARGAEMPPTALEDPLLYQGGSYNFLGPTDAIPLADESWGIDFESEIGIITDDVPMGVSARDARGHIKLIVLVNDVSLRNLIPAELAKGFGFFQSKAWTSFSLVAVTPDELGPAWDGNAIDLPLLTTLNGVPFGRPNANRDIAFGLPHLIAHAAKTRPLGAGTIIGAGTVANREESAGSSCIAERRAIETIETGAPKTPFLKFGDRVRIEMLDSGGHSIFGAIDQVIERYEGSRPRSQ